MKRNNILPVVLLLIVISTATGCEAIGGIFKAGVWGGIIIAAVVVGIILWVINKARK